ncbi:MAG: LysR family transcriptional regulator [Gemmatimonadales bacterium]|nr:LysR family transcriptional regulator [Gemmatimonadales bacterium]MYG50285.1 LysR family transcriptional regulator [Gemmatimonadales bacterium]MYK01131.1 LysR family transcriptional regulator [Candidatus Palauibacter ramosifaciens]
MSSSSIGRHVRLLENYLGTELFVRRRNGVALTSARRSSPALLIGWQLRF